MKLVVVQFPDATDLSQFPKGKTDVVVTGGTNNLSGGLILSTADVYELPPTLISHTHDAQTVIGQAP